MNSQSVPRELSQAESALRSSLHRHDLDPLARAHMERALNHAREALIAVNEEGKARTVHELADDLEKLDRLLEKVRQPESPDTVTYQMRV